MLISAFSKWLHTWDTEYGYMVVGTGMWDGVLSAVACSLL